MAKKKELLLLDDEIEDELNHLDDPGEQQIKQFDPNLIKKSSAKEVHDLFSIPVEDLVPFGGKGDGDFSAWDEKELQEMADSMDRDGSYEPILVRAKENGKFEILAGEHRVKASRIKGLKEINAVVFRACSDTKAKDIFLLTNLQRRHSKISDEIYGWSSFYKNHPNMHASDISTELYNLSKMANTGAIKISLPQLYRYVSMATLIKPIIQAMDDGVVGKWTGYELSRMPQDIQKLFVGYLPSITHDLANQAATAYAGGTVIDAAYVKKLLAHKTTKVNHYDTTLRRSMANIRKNIKAKINPIYYERLEGILDDAISDYLVKHPEYKNTETES